MLQIPAQLASQFTTCIGQQGIPAGQRRYYLKWLRYYLDFCHKYRFEQGTDRTLSAFMEKLKQKKQSAQVRQQAKQAARLYFSSVKSSKKQQDFRNEDITPQSTNISPNTYSDNRQDYKSLELGFQKPEDSGLKKKETERKGAD